ncbi:MAG: hypothetical protein Q9170_003731 [Blastenia crenularia]
MRSSPFGSVTPTANASHDLEAGRGLEAQGSDDTSTTGYLATLSLLGRGWRRGWKRARRWTDVSRTEEDTPGDYSDQHSAYPSIADQQTFDDSTATVRMRKTSRCRFAWEADSEDIERATNNQLLAPTAGFNLAHLFRRTSSTLQEADVSPSSLERGDAGVTTSYTRSTCPWHDPSRMASRSVTAAHPSNNEHRGLRNTCNQNRILQPRSPSKRIRTWTYGIENVPPQSISMSIVDEDCGSVRRGSDGGSVIRVPRTRNRGWSTDDTTAEAERMSMIEVDVGGVGEEMGLDRRKGESFE